MKSIIADLMIEQKQQQQKQYQLEQKKLQREQAKETLRQKKQLQAIKAKKLQNIERKIASRQKEKEVILKQINNIKHPVSINLTIDLLDGAKQYDQYKKLEKSYYKNYIKTAPKTPSKINILGAKLGLTILIVFIITRITSDNDYLLEQITSLSFMENFYPDFYAGLIIDFFIQDFMIISLLSITFGVFFQNKEEPFLEKAVKYSTIATVISITGVTVANYLSLL